MTLLVVEKRYYLIILQYNKKIKIFYYLQIKINNK